MSSLTATTDELATPHEPAAIEGPAATPRRFGLVGSPNCGKTTLFNALTGLSQKVGNYPGVTVDFVQSTLKDDAQVTLVDLPGTYALEALSPDEQVTLDALMGQRQGLEALDGVILVADATTLERSLPLLGQVLALGHPSAVILTMIDELKARGGALKVPKLKRALGVPVLSVVGNKGLGLDDVRHLLSQGQLQVSAATIPDTQEARFSWADELLAQALKPARQDRGLSDRLDAVVLHPALGLLTFALMMFAFFQAVFLLAAPLQEALAAGQALLGDQLQQAMSPSLLRSFLLDGVLGGVGGVLTFVPQIALLLMMIALLEGSGYMARAAFVIDRVMGWAGLEGRSFLALLSSYACAIPGIMATRTIPDPRSRLATILVAPFMTCSARLPVYGLLIAAFVPKTRIAGVISLQGLTLFGLYLLGALSALGAGALLKRGLLRGRTYPFFMELPPYRAPTAKVVAGHVWRGVKAFVRRAGTIILGASLILWALLQTPQVQAPPQIAADEAAVKAYQLEHSLAGRVGKTIEPVIAPLGMDWRIGVGILASLAAREVIVATLAQLYTFSGDLEADQAGLGERLKAARRDDGSPAYPLPTVLALLVFYVYALQCASTLVVMRRETGSWRWPLAAWVIMFAVAYGASFITYRVASALS